jgi:N-acetyl-anhydromuramyl-L-alanine amidase AmpD
VTPDFPTWLPVPSPNIFAGRKPDKPISGIVLHFTAAGSGRATAEYFAKVSYEYQGKTYKVGASAHNVIDRDGANYQCVNFADRAWHAGPATLWKGRKVDTNVENVNDWTIGIEIANWGQLKRDASGHGFLTYLDKPLLSGKPGQVQGVPATSPRAKDGTWWEMYPDLQIDAVIAAMKVIVHKYPNITREDVTGHENIQSNKADPGPFFPWERVLDSVFGEAAGEHHDLLAAQEPEDHSGHYDEQAEMCLVQERL